jgi:energy-converting hydrogenase Eha subunit F
VVASGDGVKTKPLGPLKEEIEFDYSIALNARVGRQPGGVIFDEGLYYSRFKLGGVIENVVVNVKRVSDAPSVIDVRD